MSQKIVQKFITKIHHKNSSQKFITKIRHKKSSQSKIRHKDFWPHCAHGDVHCKHVRRWVSLKVQIVLSSSVVRNAKLSHATLLRMIAAIIYVGNSPPTWRLSASWPSVGEKRAPNKIHGGPTVSQNKKSTWETNTISSPEVLGLLLSAHCEDFSTGWWS